MTASQCDATARVREFCAALVVEYHKRGGRHATKRGEHSLHLEGSVPFGLLLIPEHPTSGSSFSSIIVIRRSLLTARRDLQNPTYFPDQPWKFLLFRVSVDAQAASATGWRRSRGDLPAAAKTSQPLDNRPRGRTFSFRPGSSGIASASSTLPSTVALTCAPSRWVIEILKH